MWILQVLWTVGLASGLEVAVPERFLRPRTYNPHPYDGPTPATFLRLRPIDDLPEHPYALFRRPPSERNGQDTAPIQFPMVPEEANVQPNQPRPRIKPATVKHPLNIATVIRPVAPLGGVSPKKKYAFSYAVKDRSSGDDFSHSQAGSGAQTKGEYRVKLPDGRTQVVSYTADDQGYRADVRYDENNLVEPKYNPTYKPTYKAVYRPLPEYKQLPEYRPAFKTVFYDYDDLLQQEPVRQRDYTPIHEDYGDLEQNTVSSTPRYQDERRYTVEPSAISATATTKYVPTGTPRFVETFVANSAGSSPSAINTQYFVTTPAPPPKYFLDADGQVYRQ